MPSKVQLYIYDVTKGLAAQMSSLLLGHHIDGVWHTAIVCYSREYFFGSGGIDSIIPGTTMLGAPDKVIHLGETHLTNDLFNEYLFTVGNDQFRPEKYHLFDHNCNTFSNEIAQFLTGKKIPSYILDLPHSISNTPLGTMLRAFMDGITNSPGNTSLYNQSPMLRHPSAAQNANDVTRSAKDDQARQPVIYTYDAVKCLDELKKSISSAGNNADKSDIIDQLDILLGEVSLTIDEIVDILNSILETAIQSDKPSIMGLILDCISIHYLKTRSAWLTEQRGTMFLKHVLDNLQSKQVDGDLLLSSLKLATNLFSDAPSSSLLINSTTNCASEIYDKFKSLCLMCLLGAYNDTQYDAAISFFYNVCLSKVDEETEIEFASALLHWLNENDHKSTTGEKCVKVLKILMDSNDQIKELANMTVDLSKLQ